MPCPPFDIEYSVGAARKRKRFTDYFAGRRFYIAKWNAGAKPAVKAPIPSTQQPNQGKATTDDNPPA